MEAFMSNGLEGVVAADTALTHVDGARGVLWVRGHTPQDLIAHFGYEGATALLWEGLAGAGLTRESVRAALGAARVSAFEGLGRWLDCAKDRPLGDAVRLCFAAIPADDPAAITAALPVGIAALLRLREGNAPVAPDPTLATAADFLLM